MKKVLTVGGAMYDIFTQYEDVETLQLSAQGTVSSYVIMRAGKKIEVQELLYYCGGGAANSAVSFARAGFAVEAFFKRGNDHAGDFIMQSLNNDNISTKHVVTTDETQTGTSFIVPGPHGNRSVLVYRGANQMLHPVELPHDIIASIDQLYITSLSGASAEIVLPLVTLAKKHNKHVAINPGTSQLSVDVALFTQSLPFIDVLILNTYESQLLMASLNAQTNATLSVQADNEQHMPQLLTQPVGSVASCFVLPAFFSAIHDFGPRIVVVTNGAEGVYASNGHSLFFHPSVSTHIVSSIGAGDAFGSTFVASLLRGKTLEDSVRAGIVNSASVITKLGTQTGLLTADEVDSRVAALDKKLLQTYPLS